MENNELQNETKEKVEVLHFKETEGNTSDDAYGYTVNRIVEEYLRNYYNQSETQFDLTVDGINYKVLKRDGVTSFYYENGNTFFDVENKRLANEYDWMMNAPADSEDDITEQPGTPIGKTIDAIERQAFDSATSENEDTPENCTIMKEIKNSELSCSGTVESKCTECERMEPALADMHNSMNEAESNDDELDGAQSESEASISENKSDEKEAEKEENLKTAKEKLEEELEKSKDKTFSKPIIEYLLGRCEEDKGLAQDIEQPHKTWDKCFEYIYNQARKHAKGNRACIREDVVYEWAEDYYRKDDKAESEKKAKEDAEKKKNQQKQKDEQKKRIERMEKNHEKNGPSKNSGKTTKPVEPKKQEESKAKKNSNDMEGQLDLFTLMGM